MSEGRQASEAYPQKAVLQEVQLYEAGTHRLRRQATVGRGGESFL